MNVDIAQISTVYKALEAKIIGTLTSEYDAGRLKGKEYSDVMTSAISALITSSVASVQEQPLKDGQVLDFKVKDYTLLAVTQKDIELKDAEVEKAISEAKFVDAKILSIAVDSGVKEAQRSADLSTKSAQGSIINAQTTSETNKAALFTRQGTYYTDQAKLKTLEAATNMMGMQAASDMDLDIGLLSKINGYISTKLPY